MLVHRAVSMCSNLFNVLGLVPPRDFCSTCDLKADYLSGSFNNSQAFVWCYEVCRLLQGWQFAAAAGQSLITHAHLALQLLLAGMPLQGVPAPN